jgi:CRP-like cAMP-binding protein
MRYMVGRIVSYVAILRNHSIFGKMPARMIERLASYVRTQTVRSGAKIFAKGDPGAALMGVLSGTVQICVRAADGRQTVLNVIHAGEIFGEIALLDGGSRTADAIAMSDCELLVIERRDFIPIVHEYPEAALKLIEILCARLRRASQHVEDLVFLDMPSRLAKLLLRLTDDAGGRPPHVLSVTQREISQMIGTSRESINKQLRSWAHVKWVLLNRGKIIVLQPDALADIAKKGSESELP